jgi:two-component system, NarL family, nitrate/nitrite response regulator NarL
MNVLRSLPSKISESPPQRDARNQRVDELIRKFVGQVVSSLNLFPRSSRNAGQEEIIIDTIVDGARYLLIRMSVPAPLFVSLTPREQEIVRMVAKGYPNKTIAGVLNISTWTVGTHLRRIFAKLGVTSRAAMVARLMEERRTWDTVEPGTNILSTNKPPATSSSRPSNDKVLKSAVPEREGARLIKMIFTPVWPSVMLACGASGIA